MFTEEERSTWEEGRPFFRLWRSIHGKELPVLVERRGKMTRIEVDRVREGETALVRVEAPVLALAYQYAFTLASDILCSYLGEPAPGLIDELEEVPLHPCTPPDEAYWRSWRADMERQKAAQLALMNGIQLPYISMCAALDKEERHQIEEAAFERGRRSVLGESDGDDE
jgi:hypothetical protein